MRRTTFAGLTELAAGDPLSTDGSSFQDRNPGIIDQWLSLIVTHRHDAAAPIPNPTIAPALDSLLSGGGIPAATEIFVAYTILDSGGGETALSPAGSVITEAGIGAPASAASGSMDYSAGTLTINTYQYAYTMADGAGGETELSPPLTLDRVPGPASARTIINGLSAALAGSPGAASWRMYKAVGGEQYNLHQIGTGDTYVDDGTVPVDYGTSPPFQDTTNQTSSVAVTVPASAQVEAGVAFNVYLTLAEGQFFDPCLYGTFPTSSAGVEITITSLSTNPGSPPPVATSVRGASQIDPETDIAEWHWHLPVNTHSALPSGTKGDVRLVLDTGTLYGVLGAAAGGPADWDPLTGGGEAGGGAVGSLVVAASGGMGSAAISYLEIVGIDGIGIEFETVGFGSARVVIGGSGVAGSAGGGGGGGSPLTVTDDDATVVPDIIQIDFLGATVTDEGGGLVQVFYSGAGGSGIATINGLSYGGTYTDGPDDSAGWGGPDINGSVIWAGELTNPNAWALSDVLFTLPAGVATPVGDNVVVARPASDDTNPAFIAFLKIDNTSGDVTLVETVPSSLTPGINLIMWLEGVLYFAPH